MSQHTQHTFLRPTCTRQYDVCSTRTNATHSIARRCCKLFLQLQREHANKLVKTVPYYFLNDRPSQPRLHIGSRESHNLHLCHSCISGPTRRPIHAIKHSKKYRNVDAPFSRPHPHPHSHTHPSLLSPHTHTHTYTYTPSSPVLGGGLLQVV